MNERYRTVYIGLDETNTGQVPTFFGAVFSKHSLDCRSQIFPKKGIKKVKKRSALVKLFQYQPREYTYLACEDRASINESGQVYEAGSQLIIPYISREKDIDAAFIFIDGSVPEDSLRELEQVLSPYVESVRCVSCVKTGLYTYAQPLIVAFADALLSDTRHAFLQQRKIEII
jgi:hypothetical protein